MNLVPATNVNILQTGPRVYLRHPLQSDAEAYLVMVGASRRLHHPWVQPPSTAEAFLSYAERASSFEKEGYSPRYFKIGGRWRDHERWALLAERHDLNKCHETSYHRQRASDPRKGG
jgi:RimJ/RimL family protein N-acetyltransferase